MDSGDASPSHESELNDFQIHVSDLFQNLIPAQSEELLTLAWIERLLDTFLCCLEEFRVILLNNKGSLIGPPMNRYISDYYDRSIKAMDVCNALHGGIEQVKQWLKFLEIVLCALDNQRTVSEGQFRRAKKALVDLAIAMLEDKDSAASETHRNRSFGRSKQKEPKSFGQFRSLSWSVSRSWSAAKQLQAISSSISIPRSNETASTDGLNVAVFTMNNILFFVMWALVSAIPCQDRGFPAQFYVSRQYLWASPIVSLQDKIIEESRKQGRRNSPGLLKEIRDIEKCVRDMNALSESVEEFPLNEETGNLVKGRVGELKSVYEAVKPGFDNLDRHIREVFHRIVRSKTEGLDSLGCI